MNEALKNSITLDNIANYGNALIAHANAKRGKKHYGQVKQFERDLPGNLAALVEEFTTGTYHTGPYRVEILTDRRKQRIISKVEYRDRVAQWMIALFYQPYYLSLLNPNTHAAIPGRGIHSALAQTEAFIRSGKYTHVLKIDVRKYFPSIDRAVLKRQMEEDFIDPRVLRIICGIIDDAPMTGVPIGNYLSQFLANRYLTPFDYWIEERAPHVRYMDDIVIFGSSREELLKLFREIEWYLQKNLYLEVKGNWQVFKIEDRGVDFVGYRIWNNRTILRKSTFLEMRRKLRGIEKKVRRSGVLSESDNCRVMSYLGWIMPLSTGPRLKLFHRYFSPTIELAHLKPSKKVRKHFYHVQN